MVGAPALSAPLTALLFVTSALGQANAWRAFDNATYGDCAMTFDGDRSRFVVVSGGRTFEWDGLDWRLRTTPTPPPSRRNAHLCYDTVRGRTLLYGGWEHVPLQAPDLASTMWQYDGQDWTRHPSQCPPARLLPAIAFDSLRGRLVMFGGSLSGSGLRVDETWEWDGTSWSQMTPAVSPSARDSAAMAFHRPSGRMILFGGSSYHPQGSAETWAWDGINWVQLQPTTVPPGRGQHLMAANDAGKIVMHGGGGAAGLLTDTWEWNGTDWIAGPATAPPPRNQAAMALDPAGVALLLGGSFTQLTPGLYESTTLGDTWLYPGFGTPWIQMRPTGPPYRSGPYFAYDSVRDCLVLAGVSSGTVHHTWEWSNGTWTRMNPAVELPQIGGGRMCFDSGRGVMVLFGGVQFMSFFSSTWEWDGITWVQRLITGPPPRMWHAMAYDEARARVVVFGAAAGLADTWTYDGTAWTQAATTGPGPRSFAAMTYDAARTMIVLFGGQDPSGANLGDTWEWDGTTWFQRFPAVSPSPRWSAAFAYDRALGRSTLVGGWALVSPGLSLPVREEWHWDGTNWSGGAADVPIETRGPAIDSTALVYHDPSAALLLATPRVGADIGVSTDLWIGSLAVANVQRSGTGCSGATAPTLSAFGVPVLGDAQFRFDVNTAPANGIVVLGLGTGAGVLPLGGGCTLYLQGAIATAAALANAAGFTSLAFPIPAIPALVGFGMTAQAAALDAAAPLGLTLTSQLSVRVGI